MASVKPAHPVTTAPAGVGVVDSFTIPAAPSKARRFRLPQGLAHPCRYCNSQWNCDDDLPRHSSALAIPIGYNIPVTSTYLRSTMITIPAGPVDHATSAIHVNYFCSAQAL